MTTLHASFHNKDRVGYYRRKTLKPFSTGNSITALLNLFIDEKFIRSVSLDPKDAHVTLQTDDMINQIKNCRNSPFQSDSIHKMVLDENFPGEINITFTSMLDIILERTVPICISIMYGKSALHYEKHFDRVFACMEEKTYNEFKSKFLGNTSDFSDAERIGFFVSLKKYIKAKYDLDVTDDDLVPFYRFCNFHFKQSVTRIARNSGVIPHHLRKEFLEDVAELQITPNFYWFEKRCNDFFSKYAKAKKWLKWYLQPDRAQIMFEVCRNLDKEVKQRFSSLSRDTN